MAGNMNQQAGGLAGVNSGRLFLGSCMALISTSVAFGAVTSLMGDLKTEFALSNAQAGWVGGAALWGFTISIFIFGPLCDLIGMGRLLRFSMICHLAGPLMMVFASGFPMLFMGALVIALGNGTIEAVCNPLVATIYPNQKTKRLNQFHVWFPGGIVIGGLLAFFLDKLGPDFWKGMFLASWQAKISLVLIPTLIYGILFTGQKFPATERVQSGLSFGDMVKGTFERPLFWILFVCMSMTASLELGPGRWMNEVMKSAMQFAGTNAGILVLVYGTGLMAVLRFFAGPIVHRLSPTGMLAASAVLSGTGLYMLTYAQAPLAIVVSATVFFVGVCYFWPTILGVASERVPKGGALAMGLLGGWGMAVVGLVTAPAMGFIIDQYGHDKLPAAETKQVIERGADFLAKLKVNPPEGVKIKSLEEAVAQVEEVKAKAKVGELPKRDTAKALREIAKYAGGEEIGKQAQALVGPADDFGGLISFRWVSCLSIILIIIFGSLFLTDRSKGGYKQEHIGS
jgi:MFS family permease